ncbi:MAG: leucine-rich repeat protein [Lachnospiraceae bacterium]|nr:leucine-rich repeat protein [Lachnospiraceae bacterium]
MHEEGIAVQAAQSFAYEIRKDSAVIWRCFSRDTRAEIPAQIQGYPVTELAPYAFSAHMDERELQNKINAGTVQIYVPGVLKGCIEEESLSGLFPLCGEQLEEIVLPGTVRRVGRYCFYDCGSLHRIEFWGTLTDWGSGVFTRCHHVKELRVYTDRDGKSYLKDVLDELPETLAVEYCCPKAAEETGPSYDRAVLVFPEFYEEGVENTPARILETHVHGSGISYRNCFQGRKFDFVQYDTLFPQAKALESREVLALMVSGRLRYPVGLAEKAREQYERYVFEHAREIAGWMLQKRDLEGIRWLAELTAGVPDREVLLEEMAEHASRLHYTEAVSYLMDCRRDSRRAGRKRLEL